MGWTGRRRVYAPAKNEIAHVYERYRQIRRFWTQICGHATWIEPRPHRRTTSCSKKKIPWSGVSIKSKSMFNVHISPVSQLNHIGKLTTHPPFHWGENLAKCRNCFKPANKTLQSCKSLHLERKRFKWREWHKWHRHMLYRNYVTWHSLEDCNRPDYSQKKGD